MRQLLSDGIDEYLLWRKSQDYRPATMINESGVLKRMLKTSGNVYMDGLGQRHVTAYFADAARTRKPSTMRSDHTILTQFFGWARQTKRMAPDNNPMAGRRRPPNSMRERERVHVSKFPHLLDVAERSDMRNRAVVAVLLYTLMRDQEVANLRVGDVDLDGGWMLGRITKSRIEDRLPMSLELQREMRRWLTYYAERCGELQNDWYLLPARQVVGLVKDERGRITSHEIVYEPRKPMGKLGRVVRPILEAAGFPVSDVNGKPQWEGAHTIRRSGARALFDALVESGYDFALRVVQAMLHHSSITTTEHYIGVSADRRSRDELIHGHVMYPAAEAARELKQIGPVAQ